MLWACEEKPSEFWEEQSIVTSVRELLLDLIEKLIDRNFPHYFMSVNNIMDDLPYSYSVDNEINLLLCYREEALLELVRKESKAYQMKQGLLTVSNAYLYPIEIRFSNVYLSKIRDGYLSEFSNICNCGKLNNFFYPELEYLHRGIVIHLQLSKLSNYEDQHLRQDLVIKAEELLDRSIHKVEYGLTRIQFQFGWSLYEFCRQFVRVCRDKHFLYHNSMLYSGSMAPRTLFTSCYVRDLSDHIRNLCSFSSGNRTETRLFQILQAVALSITTASRNPTYGICSAYKANFLFNARCDYRQALDLCKEVYKLFKGEAPHLMASPGFLNFSLRNEWCGLYDTYNVHPDHRWFSHSSQNINSITKSQKTDDCCLHLLASVS